VDTKVKVQFFLSYLRIFQNQLLFIDLDKFFNKGNIKSEMESITFLLRE